MTFGHPEQKRRTGVRPTNTALGVDPGMAHTGLSVVRRQASGEYKVVEVMLVASKPDAKAASMVEDDARRLEGIFKGIIRLVALHSPDVFAIETYTPLKGKQGGNAWKTSVVYGLVYGIALANNRRVQANAPKDIKQMFTLHGARSKDDLQAMVCRILPGLMAHLEPIAPAKREHVADATAHAMLALDMQRLRR